MSKSDTRFRSGAVIALLVVLAGAGLLTLNDDGSGPLSAMISTIRGLFGHRHTLPTGFAGDEHRKGRNAAGKSKAKPKSAAGAGGETTSCVLFGTICNENNAPIPDAKVLLRGIDSPKPVSTDAKGRYRISVPPGVYDVIARHPSYVGMLRPGLPLKPQPDPVELNFTLPLGAILKGVVTDEDDRVLSGVMVAAQRYSMEQLQSGETYVDDATYKTNDTDEGGAFQLQGVELGQNILECSRRGYEVDTRVLAVGPATAGQKIKVVLKKRGTLSGSIVDTNNNPISSATVALISYKPFGEPPQQLARDKNTTISTSDGSFALDRLFNEGFYDLVISHPDYAKTIVPNVPSGTEKLSCVMERGGTIHGHAQYIDRPTTAASLIISAEAVISGTTITASTRSDADGDFSISRLPFGTYSLYAASPEFGNEPATGIVLSRDRAEQVVEFNVYQACLVRGQVLDAETDVPIEEPLVRVDSSYGANAARKRSFQIRGGKTGVFEFSRLPAGLHVALASAPGYLQTSSGSSAITITLQPGDKRTDVQLRLGRGGTVDGFVRDPSGKQGVADADVQLFAASLLRPVAAKTLVAKTDGSGHFHISGIDVGPQVQLYASARKTGYAKTRSRIITLTDKRPADTVEIPLTIGGTFVGKITDTNNKALPGALVRFLTREFPGDPSPSEVKTLAGSDGTYVLPWCPVGKGYLCASCPMFVEQKRDTAIKNAQSITSNFKLAQGYLTSGRVADFEGKPIAGARVSAQPLDGAVGTDQAVTTKDGHYQLEELGKGFFRIKATFTLQTQDGAQDYTYFLQRVASGTSTADIDCDVGNSVSALVMGEKKKLDRFKIKLNSSRETDPVQDFQFDLDRSFTTAHGLLRVLSVPRGIYSLQVTATGYETYRSDDVIIGPQKRTELPTIRLRSSGGITGVVASSSNDRPVNNATVRLLDGAKPESKDVTRDELRSYPSSEIIAILRPDIMAKSILDPADSQTVVAQVRANVVGKTQTDYSGTFVLSGMASGTYVVEIEHPKYAPIRLQNIGVSQSRQTDLGQLYLDPGGTVHGMITDGTGYPVPELTVVIRGTTPEKRAYTDRGGNYSIQGIRTGTWPVVVTGVVGTRKVYVFQSVTVSPDDDEEVDFEIRLDNPLVGVFAGGAPRTAVTARIYALNERGAIVEDVVYSASVKSGQFVIDQIPAGDYYLVLNGGGYAMWQPVEVQGGGASISLPFPTASVRGQTIVNGAPTSGVPLQLIPILPAPGLPASIVTLLTRSATSGKNGVYSFTGLQPGAYQTLYKSGSRWLPGPPFSVGDGQRIPSLIIPIVQ